MSLYGKLTGAARVGLLLAVPLFPGCVLLQVEPLVGEPCQARPDGTVVQALEAEPAQPHVKLAQLSANIDDLDKRIAGLQRMPETNDPTISEVRALDIAGWQLHQRQWTLQRDHLRFARAQLQRAKANPSASHSSWRSGTSTNGSTRRSWMVFGKQRHELERKRLQVEAQLIQHDLR